MGPGKNDFGDDGISYALFIAPKLIQCLTNNEYGTME